METLQDRIEAARKSIEDIEAARKSIEDKRAEIEKLEAFADKLKPFLPQIVGFEVSEFGYPGELEISTKATYAEAVELLNRFQLEPRKLIKDGCTSLYPDCKERQKTLARETVTQETDIAPYTIEIEIDNYVNMYGTRETVVAFTRLDDVLVKIEIKITNPSAQIEFKRSLGRGENITKRFCQLHSKFHYMGKIISWASGGPEYPNKYTAYWADYEMPFKVMLESCGLL